MICGSEKMLICRDSEQKGFFRSVGFYKATDCMDIDSTMTH